MQGHAMKMVNTFPDSFPEISDLRFAQTDRLTDWHDVCSTC